MIFATLYYSPFRLSTTYQMSFSPHTVLQLVQQMRQTSLRLCSQITSLPGWSDAETKEYTRLVNHFITAFPVYRECIQGASVLARYVLNDSPEGMWVCLQTMIHVLQIVRRVTVHTITNSTDAGLHPDILNAAWIVSYYQQVMKLYVTVGHDSGTNSDTHTLRQQLTLIEAYQYADQCQNDYRVPQNFYGYLMTYIHQRYQLFMTMHTSHPHPAAPQVSPPVRTSDEEKCM